MKVAILGASGGIGQPLSLLLTQSVLPITELSLYDLRMSKGVATDLSHITNNKVVQGYEGDELDESLTQCDVVIIVAGVPRKPGMSRDDLFQINGKIIQNLTLKINKNAKPDCLIAVISNPVNALVPLVVDTIKKINNNNNNKDSNDVERRVFGVTTLDLVRSMTFLNEGEGEVARNIVVIGGHSGKTILPVVPDKALLKQNLNEESTNSFYDQYINRVQFGGDEVVKAKDGMGSATLSMAYSSYKFVSDLILARDTTDSAKIDGSSATKSIISNTIVAYVNILCNNNGTNLQKKLDSNIEYFSTPIALELGTGFIKEIGGLNILDNLNNKETELLTNDVLPQLFKDIEKGKSFVRSSKC